MDTIWPAKPNIFTIWFFTTASPGSTLSLHSKEIWVATFTQQDFRIVVDQRLQGTSHSSLFQMEIFIAVTLPLYTLYVEWLENNLLFIS